MKKIKMIVAAVLAFFAGNAMAQNISVDAITAEPNSQASIVVKYGDIQAASAQFDLVLPEGVTPNGNAVKGDLLNNDYTVITQKLADGSFRYLIFDTEFGQFSAASGTLLTIPVSVGNVEEGALAGGEIKNIKIANQDAVSVGDVNDVNLSINVGQATSKGDFNGDGDVDVIDLRDLLGVVLGQSASENKYDLNGDGEVNVTDYGVELDIVFPTTAAKAHFAPSAEAVKNVLSAKGGTSVVLNLDNTSSYRALQFDLTLPDGLEMGDIQLASSASGMEVLSNKLDANKWRVVVACLDGVSYVNANAGSFISVKVDGTTSGEATIDNIIFADSHAQGTKFDNMTVEVFGGNTTGINGIAVDTDAEAAKNIYSVGGASRKSLQRGVNIVRDANGKVTKVIKK